MYIKALLTLEGVILGRNLTSFSANGKRRRTTSKRRMFEVMLLSLLQKDDHSQ